MIIVIGTEVAGPCRCMDAVNRVACNIHRAVKAESNIRPVDMAFPGTLPVVNKEAVRLALMASLILNCKQPEYI